MLFYFPFPAIVRLTVVSVAGGNNRVLHNTQYRHVPCKAGRLAKQGQTRMGESTR